MARWRKKAYNIYCLLKSFCCCWSKPYDAPPTNRTKPVWRYSCNLPLFCKDQNYARCLASQSRRASSFFLFENRRLNGLESRFLFDVILFSDNPLKILSYHNAKINSYLTHKNYSVVGAIYHNFLFLNDYTWLFLE